MTDQRRLISGARWFTITLTLVFVLLGAGVRTYGIKDPWVQGHMGWSGYRSGNIARNYVRYGYLETKGGAVRNIGPTQREHFFYDEHPPMIYWLTSISYHIFGVSEWSATLVPIVISSLSIGLLFLLALRLWGLLVAVLASAFMVLVPMDAYYGRMVDHEAPTLFFSLLTFYLYILWKEHRRPWFLAGVFAALLFAMLSDFPGYFVAPWLALYHFFSDSPNRSRWKVSVGLLVAAPLAFILWTLYLRWISGSFDILTSRFVIRTGGWPPWVFTLGELYRLEFLRIQSLYTPTLQLLSLVWLFFMIWDVRRRRDLSRHGFTAMLFGFGVTYLALFHQNAYQHDFVAYYLTPFMVIAAAWAVVLVAERFVYPRWHLLTALALVVLFTFFNQATASLRHLYLPREAAYVEVAQHLNKLVPPGGKIMGLVEDSTRNQWLFYLDRPMLDVTDLPLLELKLNDPSFHYFVIDTRLSETTQELREHLIRNYRAEARGAFLLFDLHDRKPTFVVDRTPEGLPRVSPPNGREEEPLTLLAYDLPDEESWPQPSAWYRYLYSSPSYWPLSPDIAVEATLYWRCNRPVTAGYVPIVTLRTDYDRRLEVTPLYAPQMQAYPPHLWEEGDIVRTDYTFKIPAGFPSTRYTLTVAWPAEASDTDETGGAGAVAVADVSILPPVGPRALDAPPQPTYPVVDEPVPGLRFVGYDLSSEQVQRGGLVRLTTYWQAQPELDADYALQAELRKGKYVFSDAFDHVTTRLWEPGKYYAEALNLALPAEILPGRYPLTLQVSGPRKGSISLTTLEVTASQPVGLLHRWGQADASGRDMRPLTPGEPLRLTFQLREQRNLNLVVGWTGQAELDRTRVEVYVVNPQWYAPRKYLTTWVVGQGILPITWQPIPKTLTAVGTNTIELRVPPPPVETHPLGWRRVLDLIVPNILQDPGAHQSGAVELDFAQVSAASPEQSWEEYYTLASIYAEREMWPEVRQVYQDASGSGIVPTDPTDLGLFFETADRLGDSGLRAHVEDRLAELLPNRAGVTLGGKIEFAGYHFRRLSPERVRVELYFRALAPMPVDYTAWVHATPGDPSLLFGRAAEKGHFTLDHGLDTSRWKRGHIYRHSYEAILLPGEYHLTLGLWRWQDGTRLWRDDEPESHTIDLGIIDLR